MPGLLRWYDARRITNVADGAAVASWPDRGPVGDPVAEATNQPTFRATQGPNGGPCVDFDGTNDKLTSSANLGLSGDVALTMFCLFSVANITTEYGVISMGDSLQALKVIGLYLKLHGNGVPSIEYGGGNPARFASYTTGWQLIVTSKSPGAINTTSVLWRNGSPQAIGGTPSTNTPNITNSGLILGVWGSATFGAVKIAEAGVFNRAITAEEIAFLSADMNRRWGVYAP
jgi:hypothetical protein